MTSVTQLGNHSTHARMPCHTGADGKCDTMQCISIPLTSQRHPLQSQHLVVAISVQYSTQSKLMSFFKFNSASADGLNHKGIKGHTAVSSV